VDKQLAETITEEAKPVVFVVNKWDLYAADVRRKEWADYLREQFRMMPWAPVAFATAKSGRNVKAVIDVAQRLFRQSRTRVPTARLNTVLREAIEANQPPADTRGRPVRLYYATQVEAAPPTIMISTSAPRSVTEPYKRYLLNTFRKALPFHEVPIRLLLRGKSAEPRDDAAS
jgi:GTP-binding protein